MLNNSVISKDLLIEKLDENTLSYLNIIEDSKVLKMKIGKISTKLYFEQEKYNLFREESEGFSKLLYLLNHNNYNNEEIYEETFKLIGFFDLATNRVLDIILTTIMNSENNICKCNSLSYVISKTSNEEKLIQIILNKLNNINSNNNDYNFLEFNKFYFALSILISNNLIKINIIVEHLPVINNVFNKYLEESIIIKNNNILKANLLKITNCFKLNRNIPFSERKSLANAGVLSIGGDDQLRDFEEPEINVNANVNFIHNYSFNKIYKSLCEFEFKLDILISVDNDVLNTSKFNINNHNANYLKSNEIYLILKNLIKLRLKKESYFFYELITEYYDCLACDVLINEINALIDYMIEPLYLKYDIISIISKNNSCKSLNNNVNETTFCNKIKYENEKDKFNKIYNIEDFLLEMSSILSIAYLGLSKNIPLLIKIIKILNKYYLNKYKKQYVDIISNIILPNISIIDTPSILVIELWNLISLLSPKTRYDIYENWANKTYSTHPCLLIKQSLIHKDISKWISNLNKDNIKKSSKSLSLLLNSNPILVLNYIFKYLINFTNYIDTFLNTLNYCNNRFVDDVIGFIFSSLVSLNNINKVNCVNDSTMNEDNEAANYMPNKFIKNLIIIICGYYKKNYNSDLSNLLIYAANKMKESEQNYCDINLIKELIQSITGIYIESEIISENIYDFAGGEKLALESMKLLKDIKQYKRTSYSLSNFITDSYKISLSLMSQDVSSKYQYNEFTNKNEINFIIYLTCLIAVNRQNILFSKILSEKASILISMYDGYQETYLLLTNYISYLVSGIYSVGNKDFKSALFNDNPLKISELIIYNFKLSPDILFNILRPFVNNLYCISEDEYEFNKQQYAKLFDIYNRIQYEEYVRDEDIIDIDNLKLVNDIFLINTNVNNSLWSYITKDFYYIFYSLKLNDIYFPDAQYNKKIEDINALISKTQINLSNSQTSSEHSSLKKEIEKLKISLNLLKEEKIKQQQHVYNTKESLKKLKDKLFYNVYKNNNNNNNNIEVADINDKTNNLDKADIRLYSNKYIIQYCLYKRIINSKQDAVYCAHFLILLISIKDLPNFSVLDILTRIVKMLFSSMCSLSELENSNLSLFLQVFLNKINSWKNKKIYDLECNNNLSFVKDYNINNKINYESISELVNFIFQKLIDTLKNNLLTKQYIPVKNTIYILNCNINLILTSKETAESIKNMLVNIQDETLEKDLLNLINMFLNILKKRINDLLEIKEAENKLTNNKLNKNNKDATYSKDNNNRKNNSKKTKDAIDNNKKSISVEKN